MPRMSAPALGGGLLALLAAALFGTSTPMVQHFGQGLGAFGAVIGPVALAWGLPRTSGSSASLMLTLEALFTAVLAWR